MNNIKRKEVLAIIPARGGSKGLPRKNIKSFNGKPLIYYSIKAGLKSKYITRLIVSTEDKEIEKVSEKCKAEVIRRPLELAKDDTPSIAVYQNVLKYLRENESYKPSIVVVLQPTSPLRKNKDIDNCIEKLAKEKCDSVITVKKVDHPPQWIVRLGKKGKVENLFDKKKYIRRQDIEQLYIPNGAVFVTWSKMIIEKNTDRGPDTRAIVMPSDRSIDIDTELDFYIAEKLMMRNE